MDGLGSLDRPTPKSAHQLTCPVDLLFISIVVTVFRKTNCQRIFLCKFALMFSGGFLK